MSALAEERAGFGSAPGGVPRPDLRRLPRERWGAALEEHFRAGLPGFLGATLVEVAPGRVEAVLPLRDELLQTVGEFVHGGTVVAFADSCAGWGCLASLPELVEGFSTIELNVNFVASARGSDALRCTARLRHGGRATQVWDADVTRERDGRNIAHARVTQYLLAAER